MVLQVGDGSTFQSGGNGENVKYCAGPSIPLGCLCSGTWSGLTPASSLVLNSAILNFVEACACPHGLCVKVDGPFPPY